MTIRTALLSLLLAASAAAFLPSAEAAEIPGPVVCVTEPCPPYPVPNPVPSDCELEEATPDRLPLLLIPANPRQTVWGSDAGCDADVEFYSVCAPPSHTNIERTVGPVHVFLSLCDAGIVDRIPDIVSTSTAQPPIYCVMAPCGPSGGLDVDTRDYYACAPPSAIHVDRTVGQHHVHVHVCDGGVGNVLPDITTTTTAMQPPIYCVMAPCPGPGPSPAPSWCAVEAATPAAVRTLVWGADAGCDIDVQTTWYCLYDEVIVERTAGPLHVFVRVCTVDVPIEPQ